MRRGELALRVLRYRFRRSEERKLLDRVFGDDDLKAIVEAAVEDEYGLGGDERSGDFKGFLAFLLENKEAIMEFILMIVSLFSEDAP